MARRFTARNDMDNLEKTFKTVGTAMAVIICIVGLCLIAVGVFMLVVWQIDVIWAVLAFAGAIICFIASFIVSRFSKIFSD